MVTIYDIAKKCGVSPSTVSKVINNYHSIPETTKQKVLHAMDELDYIPNSSAKNLSKGSSNNVGILSCFGTSITPFQHPLFIDILTSFQAEINKKNYDLLFISRTLGTQKATFYKNCVSRNVDGVLMLGDLDNPEMREVIQSDIPSVGFDYKGALMSGVSSNNCQLMYELTSHLLSLGHRQIIFISGEDNEITKKRIEGFKKALHEYDVEYNDEMVISSKYIDFQNIEAILLSLINNNKLPTAIMFPDDYCAAKGMLLLKKYGINCPQDISITGFDGIELGKLITPKLTTAKQNCSKIGRVLARALFDMMHDPSVRVSIEVDGTIIIGESTRKI